MPMTPIGTRVWVRRRPLGRLYPRTISPTGSGRVATWRTPWVAAAEQQAVELARIHAVFLGFEHVQRVGGFDVRSMLVQRVRNGKQQFVFGFGICLCKTLLCACGLIGLAAHRVEHLRTQFIAHKKQE